MDSEKAKSFPMIHCVVTGKGAGRDEFLKEVKNFRSKFVGISSVWLEPEDYPRLMGVADIGISLHASSSGLDLPMKVVDMLGSGTPALALRYNCIGELLKEGENGFLFSTPKELAEAIVKLLEKGFPNDTSSLLNKLKENVKRKRTYWQEEWDENVKFLFV